MLALHGRALGGAAGDFPRERGELVFARGALLVVCDGGIAALVGRGGGALIGLFGVTGRGGGGCAGVPPGVDAVFGGLPPSFSSSVNLTPLTVRVSLPAPLWTSTRNLRWVESLLGGCCFCCWALTPALSLLFSTLISLCFCCCWAVAPAISSFFSSLARRVARSWAKPAAVAALLSLRVCSLRRGVMVECIWTGNGRRRPGSFSLGGRVGGGMGYSP